jgi:hypothetical protein
MADNQNPLVGMTAADFGFVEPSQRKVEQIPGAPPTSRKQESSAMSRDEAMQYLSGKSASDFGYVEKQPSPGMDVLKSVGSGLQSAAIGVATLPIDVPTLLGKAADYPFELARTGTVKGYNWLRGQSDTPEGEARLENLRKSREFQEQLREQGRIKLGYQDVATAVEPYAKKVFGVGPLYEPETQPGKFTKTITEFAAPGLAGKAKTAEKVIRTGANILGGAGSEAAGQYAEAAGLSPTAEAAARILGGLGFTHYGQRIGTSAKNIISPTEKSEQLIAEKISGARQRGVAPTEAEVQEAMKSPSGAAGEIAAYDLLGKKGKDLVEQGMSSPGGKEAAEAINDMLAKRQVEASKRINASIDQLYGGTVDAQATLRKMNTGIAVDNPVLFKQAMSAPQSQNVRTGVIDAIESQPLAQQAINDAAKAFNLPKQTAKAPLVSPDNLSFWHEVKTNLDDQVNKAFLSGDNTLGRNLQKIRDNLRSDLKKTVPDYGNALDISSQYFQGKNAIEAGYNFGKSYNPGIDLQEKIKAFKKYGPAQQRQFEEGHMLALKEKGTSGAQGSGPIWSNIDAEKAKIAAMYGPQKANRLSAIANAEDAMNLKNMIEMHPNIQKPGMIEQGIQLARAPVSFAALAHMLVAPSAATIGAGMVGVGEVAKRLVLTVEERRIASEVNRLLSSQNPGTVLRLSKMAEKNPAVNTLMEKYNTLMAEMLTANVQLRPSTERTMERQERKSGGRVSDRLVAMVDRSKKNINNSTQSLLQTPDSHVAHALEIANRNLEG